MFDFPSLLAIVAAFAVGMVLGWALARSGRTVLAIREENARLRTELGHQQRLIPEQLALLDRAKADLKTSFEALASSALRSSTDEFLKLADQKLGHVHKDALGEVSRRQQALDELISPIRDALSRVDVKLVEHDRDRLQTRTELTTLLRSLIRPERS